MYPSNFFLAPSNAVSIFRTTVLIQAFLFLTFSFLGSSARPAKGLRPPIESTPAVQRPISGSACASGSTASSASGSTASSASGSRSACASGSRSACTSGSTAGYASGSASASADVFRRSARTKTAVDHFQVTPLL